VARVIISDMSPLRYLVLIDQIDILPGLYAEVLIPESVASELNQLATPELVRHWISLPPS
jgi:predicted nucleic acid-binding protein